MKNTDTVLRTWAFNHMLGKASRKIPLCVMRERDDVTSLSEIWPDLDIRKTYTGTVIRRRKTPNS